MGSNVSRGDTREVLDAIRRIVQGLRESSRDAEQRVGLSGAQLFVLRAVAESPGLSLNDLAERTRTHQSSVSAVVTRLRRKGLVGRSTAAGDARRAEIRLSARGRSRLRSAPRSAQERLIAAVDALAPSDRSSLAAMLHQLVDSMGFVKGHAPMLFERARKREGMRARA